MPKSERNEKASNVKTLLSYARARDYDALLDAVTKCEKLEVTSLEAKEVFIRSAFAVNISLIDRFLAMGLDINCDCKGLGILPFASMTGDGAFVQNLLNRGAHTNQKGAGGANALISACRAGAQVPGESLREPFVEIATILLTSGILVDAKDTIGITSLDIACESDWVPLTALLLRFGASITACEQEGTVSAASAVLHAEPQILKLLLEHGMSPDICATRKNMKSLIELAALHGRPKAVRLLVAAGANPLLSNGTGALDAAAEVESQREALFAQARIANEGK